MPNPNEPTPFSTYNFSLKSAHHITVNLAYRSAAPVGVVLEPSIGIARSDFGDPERKSGQRREDTVFCGLVVMNIVQVAEFANVFPPLSDNYKTNLGRNMIMVMSGNS